MKTLKKIMAFAVCLVMVLAMTVTAFADDTTQTYTITAPENTHSYEVYQIFTGVLSGGILSDVKWGQNAKNKDNSSVTVGGSVDKTILDEIAATSTTSDKEKLSVINQYVDLGSSPVATISNKETYEAPAGYYLIKDKDDSVTGNDVYTTYIVKVVGNVNIQAKGEAPEFTKKVKDKNDTTGVETDWQDSADYDLGDSVPFQLKCTIPSNYADYEHYYLAFHDVEEEGLVFNDDIKVYVGNNEITDKATIIKKPNTGNDGQNKENCTFEVVFEDLKTISDIQAGSVIRVEYTSTLSIKDANVGQQGNVNSAKLVYSNNPSVTSTGKPSKPGESPWDNVIVFTYKLVINKVDQEGAPLGNAAFKLEKQQPDGSYIEVKDYVNEAAEGKTSFEFSGLDEGVYKLTETKTPTGYNSIDEIIFTVTADHKITWETEGRTEVLESLSGKKTSGQIEFTLSPSSSDKGELDTNIINQSGSTLPSTGGIGTRIFYIIGGLLMAAAAVVLITKVRFNKNK